MVCSKCCQLRILYLINVSFKKEKEIKTFTYKQNWGFIIYRHVLQEILKEVLQTEMKWHETVTWFHMKKSRTLLKLTT